MSQNHLGFLEMEVGGKGRRQRWNSTRLTMRCDAAGIGRDRTLVFLSVAGPESTVKALAASLNDNASRTTYQVRCDLGGEDGQFERYNIERSGAGYKIRRQKLSFGYWQIVATAKLDGFLSVLTEDTLWDELRSDKYTCPLLRSWVPWLQEKMLESEALVTLEGFGQQAGVLQVTDKQLEELVSEGIKSGSLSINGKTCDDHNGQPAEELQSLDEYMLTYGPILGRQAERSLEPLHVPGRDPLPDLGLLREPFEAQSHLIESVRKAMTRQKAVLMVGEMGVGKTLAGMAAIHAHAQGKPYRSLVFCPGQLVKKWQRELEETIPGAQVIQIESWKDLLHLDRTSRASGSEWYVIARDRAKLGAKWKPAFNQRQGDHHLRCPGCGGRLVNDKKTPLDQSDLAKKRLSCEYVLGMPRRAPLDAESTQPKVRWVNHSEDSLTKGCGTPLWSMTGELWRYEPALYIKRRLQGFFDYLILDEVHEEKGAETAQGNAAGALASACKKVLALTGTLIGGKAEHLRPLLFRLAPSSLVGENLSWSDATAFNELYGRIETTIRERSGGDSGGDDNRMSRGSSRSVTKSVQPGVMPSLFGRHLIDKAVFLGLSEVASNLPHVEEECVPLKMDKETSDAYRAVEKDLMNAIKQMVIRGDRRLLGTMLHTLLAYPDLPFDWEPVGYWEKGEGSAFHTVSIPRSLDKKKLRPKEKAILDLCQEEKAKGRQVWVYVQYTDKHDVQGRLESILKKAGLRVGILRSTVSLAKREEWINRNAPKLDVVISHPKLVETGLDLFDKRGAYNFPVLVFYETGYNLFTLRQASRRSWRIGQRESCRIVYFYYAGTMQSRAMALMGKKLTAAQALEGKFSSEGLAALAGDDASVEMALARSLVNHMDEGDARRIWNKVTSAAPAAQPGPKLAERPPQDNQTPPGLSGEDLCSLMRRAKVTVKALSQALDVTQVRIKQARKEGVPGSESAAWLTAIGPVPDTLPMKRRSRAKTALNAASVAAMWLLSLLLSPSRT